MEPTTVRSDPRRRSAAAIPNNSSCGHDQIVTDEPERLLTIQDVAEWIGVSVSTLYHRSSRSEGPNRIKIGNALRYKRCCVAAWIDQQLKHGRD